MNIREFESLPLEEQERVFHQSPFKEKGELLLHSHDPVRLARSLSQEELYLVTKEMDMEERSDVVRYASLPQLVFISDVDCWKKDRIDATGFTHWLEILLKADENRLLAWMNEMDPETVISGFKKLIRVLKPDHEYAADEILGDTPYFTLDNMYYISVEEENIEMVKRAIEVLFENQRGRYVALLEEVMSEMDDVIEEDAYQKREMRLAERGFPDFETARKIYRPISKEEFDAFPIKKIAKTEKMNTRLRNVPNYPVLWKGDRLFLDDLLLLFRDDESGVRDSLQEELAWLSNKVIACDGIDFSSEEKVRQGIERARCFVNLGLERLAGSDLNLGKEILTDRWLEIIFRAGVSELNALHEQAQKLIRDYWRGSQVEFLQFLNPPYEFIIAGLLRPVPEFYSEDSGTDDQIRDFKKMSDVRSSKITLDQIETILKWLKENNVPYRSSEDDDFEKTLFSVLTTDFLHFVLGRSSANGKVSEAELKTFIEKAFEPKGSQKVLKPALKESYLSKRFSNQDRNSLRTLWALVFDNIEEELGRLNPEETIKPEYVSMVQLKNQKAKPKVVSKSKGKKRGPSANRKNR